jgi:hypothetical protein
MLRFVLPNPLFERPELTLPLSGEPSIEGIQYSLINLVNSKVKDCKLQSISSSLD